MTRRLKKTRRLCLFALYACGLGLAIGMPSPSTAAAQDAGAPVDFPWPGTGEVRSPFSLSGYAESETIVGLKHRYTDGDGQQRTSPRKAEAHVKLDMTWNPGPIRLNTTVHGYGYLPGRDVTDPSYDNSVVLPECYLSYVQDRFDIQVGQQVIKWGKADTLNPTSYFNPYDLRENLLKDDDELFVGVLALKGTVLFDDCSLQAVITPRHTPAKLPKTGEPWQLIFQPVTLGAFTLPIRGVRSQDALETSFDNAGYGLRFAGTRRGVDASLSFYRGPDRDLILKPEPVIDPSDPAGSHVVMVPQYEIVSSVGADLAFTLSDITVQAEAAFTPDKPAPTDPARTLGVSHLEKTGHLFWDAGFTWIPDANTVVIVEFIDSVYTNRHNRYLSPLFSTLLSATITRKLMDERLTIELKGLYNTRQRDSLLMPSLMWDFQNGVHLTLSAGIFSGTTDTLFGSYDQRDILRLALACHF